MHRFESANKKIILTQLFLHDLPKRMQNLIAQYNVSKVDFSSATDCDQEIKKKFMLTLKNLETNRAST
jgi:hypothetical protein